MLSVEITLLTGRYNAGASSGRQAAEWPPHPARLFYAAVNAVFDVEEPSAEEIAALEWWEQLEAPAIFCSDQRPETSHSESAWASRAVVEHYVPNNYASSWARSLEGARETMLTAQERAANSAPDDLRAARAAEKQVAKYKSALRQSTGATPSATASVAAKAKKVLPEFRTKQARHFPSIRPDDPIVRFAWPTARASEEQIAVLDGILSRVARLGHSSSMISARAINTAPSETSRPTWVPVSSSRSAATLQLRTPASGLLRALVQDFNRHGGTRERVLPAIETTYQRAGSAYTTPSTELSWQGTWYVMTFTPGQQLPLCRTFDVTKAVRDALIAYATQPVAPVISGHAPGSGSTPKLERPHMSVLALPTSFGRFADSSIGSVAVALPHDASEHDRAAVETALRGWSDHGHLLTLSGGVSRHLSEPVRYAIGPNTLSMNRSERQLATADRSFWARTDSTWTTVTPIAFDLHPKTSRTASKEERGAEINALLSHMTNLAGLPPLISARILPRPLWSALPPVRTGRRDGTDDRIPRYGVDAAGRGGRFTAHVTLEFAEPVRGPIALGAGRHYGYGLMLPVPRSMKEA